MSLEASGRLIDIICVNWRCTCGCISRPTFKLSASLLDIMGKSKEISQDPRKQIVDLHKSGSSLGAISKHLKVPRSSVQTIVRKYKHSGTTQLSYRSGKRRVLSPRDERTLVQKVKINPRTTAKDLVNMLEETGTKVSISTVKQALHRHNLKDRSTRKKPLLQNRHKKPDYGLQLHMGTKIVLFGGMSAGLMKQK
uniref:Transposase Tc1-like domain-containing protein n=1 Tax=Oncorhynchus tshawytscha TaxID=74940 RepID=A0AAZ3S3B5_ONCTS